MLRLSSLRDKSRIEVPRGVVLYGVADYTGTLAPNHVYIPLTPHLSAAAHVQVDPPKEDADAGQRVLVVSGQVLVIKNPCHLVSDLQILHACRRGEVHPALRDLADVIVFSVQGQRPVADRMAGSDLDGDQFSVVWDEKLVPQ